MLTEARLWDKTVLGQNSLGTNHLGTAQSWDKSVHKNLAALEHVAVLLRAAGFQSAASLPTLEAATAEILPLPKYKISV